ncbi:hypothetical protein BGZ97_007031 [Linnemannia gamsii]|uniref:rhizopuspepsin n=1 Tax=Linnemannia gamsii TaxID=64522 RepID=A0A9P6URB6_9FUNG|nr:hypothetical protein BGZ97_007031 [Linnemannia gamsii]
MKIIALGSITLAAAVAMVTNAENTTPSDGLLRIPLARSESSRLKPDSTQLWYHTLHKYGLFRTKSEMESQAVAEMPLFDYYGLVDIGTPSQTVKLQFDTGSSRFVVSTTKCPDCSGTSPFNSDLSSSYRPGVEPWQIHYGDGSFAEGFIAEDKVTLGPISVQNQKLNLVVSESPNFDDTVDGVLGLSFGVISGSTTLFENMIKQELVDQGVFSFFFGKRSINGGGEVIFGGVDMDRIEPGSTITYTNVTEATHWNIDIQDFLVNGGSYAKYKNKAHIRAIVDTGTTLLVGPEVWVSWYHNQIAKARRFRNIWVVPCKGTGTLSVVIEGKSFVVPYEDLAREYIGFGLCFSSVQSSSADYLILGDVFLKNNYVVFDQAEKRVGFAPLKAEDKKVTSPAAVSEVENAASVRVQKEL